MPSTAAAVLSLTSHAFGELAQLLGEVWGQAKDLMDPAIVVAPGLIGTVDMRGFNEAMSDIEQMSGAYLMHCLKIAICENDDKSS